MSNKTIHILLVEDDPFLAEIYVTRLEAEQFTVALSRNGEEGLQKIKETHPDLVLLDLVLPDRDGFSILEEVKKDEATKAIPVVILSNLGEKQDIARGMSLGAADYIVKAHFTPSEVVAKVTRVIQKQETPSESSKS